ncbi:MAG: hypothetical protein ACYC3L_15785 [Gemmatimonadaceae bacterium]
MSPHRRIVTVLAALLVAAPLFAQDLTQPAATPATTAVVSAAPVADAVADRAPVSGPTMQSSTVGVRANLGQPAPVNAPVVPSTGHSPALMIVGVAALLVGAVVGGSAGTIVMIVGGVMGLVGLWNYLQ